MRLKGAQTFFLATFGVLLATVLVAASAAGLDSGLLGYNAWPETQIQEDRGARLPLADPPAPRPGVRRQSVSFAAMPLAAPSASPAPVAMAQAAPRRRAERPRPAVTERPTSRKAGGETAAGAMESDPGELPPERRPLDAEEPVAEEPATSPVTAVSAARCAESPAPSPAPSAPAADPARAVAVPPAGA